MTSLAVKTAAAIAAGIAVMLGGVWIRSSARQASLAQAITRGRWDEALAIAPRNPEALVGRARAKLQANPAEIEGAFTDLEQALRQPGAGTLVQAALAEAHTLRAAAEARAGRLDRANEDLQTAIRGGVDQAMLEHAKSAIAEAWLARAEQAAAKGDGAGIKTAADKALAAGTDRGAVIELWRKYVDGRIAKLDREGLELACAESKRAGLDGAEQGDWWIRFGTTAAGPPHENAEEVIRAADKAAAAGASAAAVAPVKAKGMLLAAVAAHKKGDEQTALSELHAASRLDPGLIRETLINPIHETLRSVVQAEHRNRFDEAVGKQDWQQAVQIAASAMWLDESAAGWVNAAVAPLPPTALPSLPPEVMLQIPPIRNSIGIELKLLPAGSFTMGQAGGNPDETPHQVTLTKAFYIGVSEVTNAQWNRVMDRNPSPNQEEHVPVTNVTWDEAVAFCRQLSVLPEERRSARIYRLPTEAEWEYACRAGTNTTYSFGNHDSKLDEYAWHHGNASRQTQAVRQKKPNAWGLYDMHGNVSEWCSDWYGDYGVAAAIDPQGPSSASSRVFRGGSEGASAWACRSAQRYNFMPSARLSNTGFRIALSLSEVPLVPRESTTER